MAHKVIFISEAQAERALRLARRSRDPNRRECRCYFCPECKGWHLTSNPMREPRREISIRRVRDELTLGELIRDLRSINP